MEVFGGGQLRGGSPENNRGFLEPLRRARGFNGRATLHRDERRAAPAVNGAIKGASALEFHRPLSEAKAARNDMKGAHCAKCGFEGGNDRTRCFTIWNRPTVGREWRKTVKLGMLDCPSMHLSFILHPSCCSFGANRPSRRVINPVFQTSHLTARLSCVRLKNKKTKNKIKKK